MRALNIVVVYDPTGENLLFCKRRKKPFLGLYNFVGGKLEPGEEPLQAAYRELHEETGIPSQLIDLRHFMDFTYYLDDLLLQVFVGKLKQPFAVHGTENQLLWSPTEQNFFDETVFAGHGNIGHILAMLNDPTAQKF